MADKLEEFPTRTGNSKYDWDRFFNGEIWKLNEGHDFTVPVASFRGALYAAKSERNIVVETAKIDNEDGTTSIVVRAIPGAVPKARKPRVKAKPAAKKTAAKKATPAKAKKAA